LVLRSSALAKRLEGSGRVGASWFERRAEGALLTMREEKQEAKK